MNLKTFLSLAPWVATLVILGGCTTPVETPAGPDAAKYSIDDTDKYVALDKATAAGVECTGLRERIKPEGQLEVVANLKNLTAGRSRLKINCVFKDAKGFSIGDETAFQTVELEGGATETVRFTATKVEAKRYTIRVRRAR